MSKLRQVLVVQADRGNNVDDPNITQDSTALDNHELAIFGFGKKAAHERKRTAFYKHQDSEVEHLKNHARSTGFNGHIMRGGKFTKRYIAHIKKVNDPAIAHRVIQFHHKNQLGVKHRLGYHHGFTTAVVDAGPDPHTDDFHDLNAEHSMTEKTENAALWNGEATHTMGDNLGEIMDGRQFVGTLLDYEFNEVPVWYQPRNNTHFRGSSTLVIPDRTVAYGNWKVLSTNGKFHVRKLRAFLDKQLPPDRRTPDYKALKIEINPSELVKSVDTTIQPKTQVDLTGGTMKVTQDRRLWDDETSVLANEQIDMLLTQMHAAGFSFVRSYYSVHYAFYDAKLDSHVLFNLSTSRTKSIAEIENALAAISWNFQPLEYQWPSYNGVAPTWRGHTQLANGKRLVMALDYAKSTLTFDLR